MLVIHAYKDGLAGVRAANPGVKLSLGLDPALADEPVLVVDYPVPTNDPAGRDVGLDADTRDWTVGRAIFFRIKPAHAIKLSVSFLDRNRVAYTMWTELQGGIWQPVRVSFDEIRPNPYFQLPDAKTGTRIDPPRDDDRGPSGNRSPRPCHRGGSWASGRTSARGRPPHRHPPPRAHPLRFGW